MALLGYKLVLKVGGSIFAASTDVNLDITGEALETTTQTSEMNESLWAERYPVLLRAVIC